MIMIVDIDETVKKKGRGKNKKTNKDLPSCPHCGTKPESGMIWSHGTAVDNQRRVIRCLVCGAFSTEQAKVQRRTKNSPRLHCPQCDSTNTKKNGKDLDGCQKIYCNDCGFNGVPGKTRKPRVKLAVVDVAQINDCNQYIDGEMVEDLNLA